MADLQARGGESTVYDWNATSNNQFVLSGKGSLIMNAISPIRRAEDLGMPFAPELWIWPIPGGPGGRMSLGQYTAVYSVWKFAKNRAAAERFIADVCLAASEATPASRFFNYPTFPGACPLKRIYKAAAADTNAPKGQVLDPHDRGVAVHAQRRLPGICERRRAGGPRQIPRAADVRAGVAGQGERRRLGARDCLRDEAHLGEVARRREDLARDGGAVRQPSSAASSRR